MSEWEDILNVLKKDPHHYDVFRILQISFEALTSTEKSIFLIVVGSMIEFGSLQIWGPRFESITRKVVDGLIFKSYI